MRELGRMKMHAEPDRPRWLVIGCSDDLGRHYEAEASTRKEAERPAAGWSGVIVDQRLRLRWSLEGPDSRAPEAGHAGRVW